MTVKNIRITKINSGHRVTLPKEFMMLHDLRDGDYVQYIEVKDKVIIIPLSGSSD